MRSYPLLAQPQGAGGASLAGAHLIAAVESEHPQVVSNSIQATQHAPISAALFRTAAGKRPHRQVSIGQARCDRVGAAEIGVAYASRHFVERASRISPGKSDVNIRNVLAPSLFGNSEHSQLSSPSPSIEFVAGESIFLRASVAEQESAHFHECAAEVSVATATTASYQPTSALNTHVNWTRYESFASIRHGSNLYRLLRNSSGRDYGAAALRFWYYFWSVRWVGGRKISPIPRWDCHGDHRNRSLHYFVQSKLRLDTIRGTTLRGIMSQDSTPNRLPGIAYAIAGLTIVSMIIWSVVQWPAMEPNIVTREAAGNHGTSSVSRVVSAGAMPLALILLTILIGFAPRVDARYLKLLGDPGTAGPSNRKASPRLLALILIAMSVLLAALHLVVVNLHMARELPITSLVASAVGVLLIFLGFALPMVTPRPVTGYEFEQRLRDTQRRVYRTLAPLVMIVTGTGTIVSAWIAPGLALPLGIGGVLLMFAGIVIAAVFRARAR